ncbi:unnamed protein product [Cylindrotheca closterium]|uniref:Fe2OG dioxygenase domain-containing protein n=1 Tax=Cylindrotheca closterium TaxID=2856 RepID=A0AAD2FFM6_9STRA|nr:unnamed protein product [Cylindrotheca closterium]
MATKKLDDDDDLNNRRNQTIIKATPIVATNDSWVTLYEDVLDPTDDDSEQILHELYQNLPWNVETDQFGPQSRPTCYFADPECTFSYVGLKLDPPSTGSTPGNNKWHPTVQKLRECVTRLLAVAGPDDPSSPSNESSRPLLTACLVNLYPQNKGFIPWHSDEIRAHGKDKVVASLSLGGPRRFQLRRRRRVDSCNHHTEEGETKPRMVADLWLPSGSVLLMKGEVQEHFEHCLPLEPEIIGDDAAAGDDAEMSFKKRQEDVTINPLRISLTFRSIVPGYESSNNRTIATDQ